MSVAGQSPAVAETRGPGTPCPEKAERRWRAVLYAGMAIYVVVFLRLTFGLYDRFGTESYDLAIFHQAAWLISRGHAPLVTVRGLHLLADHSSLILYALAPLYHLWDSPKVLLSVQTLALASGALPVYALAGRRVGSAPVAAAFGLAYLLFPAMQWTNAFEFHPETLATPLLLGAFCSQTTRRWNACFALLALALLTKVTVGLTVMAFGLYMLFVERRAGAGIVALGGVGLALSLAIVRHHHGGPSAFYALYGECGDSPSAFVWSLLRRPGAVASALTDPVGRSYLMEMLGPFGCLWLAAPEVLAVALPALLLNLLNGRMVMHTICYQYSALLTPWIVAAAVVGCGRIVRWSNQRARRRVLAILMVNLAVSSAFGTGHGPLLLPPGTLSPGLSRASAAETQQMLRLVPSDASVSASPALLAHLAGRRRAYLFPNPAVPAAWGPGAAAVRQIEEEGYPPYRAADLRRRFLCAPVDYIAVCPPTSHFPTPFGLSDSCLREALLSPAYGIVAVGRDTVLLRRGADHSAGLRLLTGRVRPDARAVRAAIGARLKAPTHPMSAVDLLR
ncbi:MAG: DUF2079 domain-containing protein [Chthonomonadales bacterium]|nr:DUF2079 domain-containing protein [Chthonomonadales bacterium]